MRKLFIIFCAVGVLSPQLAFAEWEMITGKKAYEIITKGKTLQSGAFATREKTYHAKETHFDRADNFGRQITVQREGTTDTARYNSMVVSIVLHEDTLYKCHVGGAGDTVNCKVVPVE